MQLSRCLSFNLFLRFMASAVLIGCISFGAFGQEGVSISDAGAPPDASAILDLQSTTKGLLIPRLTTNQRTNMNNPPPATGLLVFDTDYNSFWFYTGSEWVDLRAAVVLEDADHDTKIQVEESPDEDIIRFDVAGNEVMRHDGKTLHLQASGGSVFVGEGAGTNDDGNGDGVDNENTFIGVGAGFSNTFGIFNTVIGNAAGTNMTIGIGNTVIGRRAGFGVGIANKGTFVGTGAGYSNFRGNDNHFIGFEAGYNNDVPEGVHFTGYRAGYANTTGENNMFVGYRAGTANTTGSNNMFVGRKAGVANTTSEDNIFIGNNAGAANTISDKNTFIGQGAGEFKSDDNGSNLFIGYQSGQNSSSGSNLFIGYQSGQNNSGWNGVFIGTATGRNNQGGNNHFVGYAAGADNTTGEHNYFSGHYAGAFSTTGNRNHFAGYQAGMTNEGSWNHFTGYEAGRNNTTGFHNYFSGYRSGDANQSGAFNVFVGNGSGGSNTTGSANVFNGYLAGSSNTTGENNVYMGLGSGQMGTFSSENVAIGFRAGQQNTLSENVFVGFQAGEEWTGPSGVVAMGANAAREYTGAGTWTVAIGKQAGEHASGAGNTIVGGAAGNYIEGSYNTIIGHAAGWNFNSAQTSTENTIIGYFADVSSGATNSIAIGSQTYAPLSNSVAIGDDIDYIGIGIEPANDAVLKFSATTAKLTTGGTWQNASDRNLKENFNAVDSETILQKVAALPITEWNYINEDDTVRHLGPMAQDFHAIFGLGGDDKTISTIDPAGVALAAIQALDAKQQELIEVANRCKVLEQYYAKQQMVLDALVKEVVALRKMSGVTGDSVTQ
ncbi:MAG: tail fiber domain-containing protein [Saprospiraceae bacterium]|nr:tail fiber domain-containing protein [Saprospiraceae bacterium]